MQHTFDSQVFEFEDTHFTQFNFHDNRSLLPQSPLPQSPLPQSNVGTLDLTLALGAAGEAAYQWDVASDKMGWSDNATEVLGCTASSLATGRDFANLLDTDNLTTRYETVLHSSAQDLGQGVSFQIEYLFRPEGRKNPASIWLEDTGRWQAGADGRAHTVFGTVRRIDARHARDQHLSNLGNADALTGAMNRTRLTEVLGEAIASTKKLGGNCCFVIAALGNLNQVNETYGFGVADEVIVAASQRLRQVMRQGDAIARFDTNKFGMILNDCDESNLLKALLRFEAALHDTMIETKSGPVWASLALGAVVLPKNGDNAAQAISHAEEAAGQAAQEAGHSKVIYQHSAARQSQQTRNTRWAFELSRSLANDGLQLAYQPIVDRKTHLPIFHEALMRIELSGDQQPMSTAQLMPMAETLGLAGAIDRSVFQRVIQSLNDHANLRLSMNVSGTTIADAHWSNQLFQCLASEAAAATRLTIEISEDTAIANFDATRRFMEKLREAGASVALDRFGQNHAAFRQLSTLPINILKLDGNLCRGLTVDSANEYLVKSVLGLSAKLNVKSVATWVESSQDAELLARWGADYLQGHHFGAPSHDTSWMAGHVPAQMPDVATPNKITALETAVVSAPTTAQLPDHFDVESVHHVATPPPQSKSDEPVSDQSPTLDFSAIDESIGRLRDALKGLSAVTHTRADEQSAVHAA